MSIIPTAIPWNPFTTWAEAHKGIFQLDSLSLYLWTLYVFACCYTESVYLEVRTDDVGLLGFALRHCKQWDVMCCCYLKRAWSVKNNSWYLDLNHVFMLLFDVLPSFFGGFWESKSFSQLSIGGFLRVLKMGCWIM